MGDYVRRYGFIGEDKEGNTVFGHKYADCSDKVTEWLNEQNVVKQTVGFFFVPDDLVLEYSVLEAVNKVCGKIALEVFYALNDMALEGKL